MLRKANLWLSVLFLLVGISWEVGAAARNTEISFSVDKQKYDKYLAETAALNDRYKWQDLLKNPDFYKRAAAARSLRFEMFKSAFGHRYVNFPAQELLNELKFLALNDGNLLVRMEAGFAWLVWSRIGIQNQNSQQELKEMILPFLRGLTISDPVIKELSFEGSGAIKSFLGARHNNAEVINAVFHEIKQQLGQVKEESLKIDVFYMFLSFLSTQQQGVLFDDLSIQAEGKAIDINQINELLKWGLQTKDNAICVMLFAHYNRWLVYPEFMPELLELLNHDNANNSGDIRQRAVECLKLIDPGKVTVKLREGYRDNRFAPKLLEAYALGADLGVKEAGAGLENRLNSKLTMDELAVISEALRKLKGREAVSLILACLDNIISWDSVNAQRISAVLKEYEPHIIDKLGARLKTSGKNGRETICMFLRELKDKRCDKYLIECSDSVFSREETTLYSGQLEDKPVFESLKRLSADKGEKVENSDKEKTNFISSEKASEILLDYPEVKAIQEKFRCERHQCVGRGFGSGISRFPKKDYPFYVMHFNVTQEIEKSAGVYESREIFSKLFYIDAYTEEVYSQEAVQQRIAAKEQAENERQKEQSELIEKEHSLKAELEKRYQKILDKRLYGVNDEYRKLLQEEVPLFVKLLEAVTPEIRYQCAVILGQLARFNESMGGYKAKQAIPGLIKLLKDKEYGTRYQAVDALSEIGEKGDQNLIGEMLLLLNDSDSLVRRGAISALSKLGDSSLTPIFVSLLGDSSVNQEAVKALIQVGDERALEPLTRLFNNRDYSYLEKDIVYALGQVGGKKSIPVLIGLLGREYTYNAKFGRDFEPMTPYVGADAAQALAKIGKDAVDYLVEALKSKDYLTRLYAVYALSLIKDNFTLGPLNKALTGEENPTVKIYIQKTIADIEGMAFIPSFANLEATLESSKQKYKRKEEIKLSLCLQNKGPEPMVINLTRVKYNNLWFNIITPDNKPAAYIGPKEDKATLFPRKDSLMTLSPGQVYKESPFSVQEYYDFSKPGEYRISGIYRNDFNAVEFGVYAWVGKLESQPIIITIE